MKGAVWDGQALVFTDRLTLRPIVLGHEAADEIAEQGQGVEGWAVPDRDYPDLIALARDGRLNLADQVSGIWPLVRIGDAIAALKAGEVTRALVDHQL